MSFYCLKIWHRTFSWSVSRPAEVQPWEVRSAHPCRARARHPIHKAMGGHACPKQTVPRKRFIRYNLTLDSHFVPNKTFKQDEIFCNDEATHLQTFPRKARQECNDMDSPSATRIRTLQQAPFADFAAEDLVQRSHGRTGGGGLKEIGDGCGQ